MAKRSINTVFIVGAGFSNYAGLPLQSKFTKKLLEPRNDKQHPDHDLVIFLTEFINKIFDHSRQARASYWPQLEDIFTCIDLAANTGHHLGFAYPPSKLRTVRRALLTRIIGMLHHTYGAAQDAESPHWQQLSHFIDGVQVDTSAFISMNWDTVIEQKMEKAHLIRDFDYCCRATRSEFPPDRRKVRVYKHAPWSLPIIKMHGSINWLYCDSCRRLHWFPANKTPEIAAQLLSPEEWKSIDPERESSNQWRCSRCPDVCLGTRIATFSYRKALDFPMFQQSWLSAEQLLRKASRWVFIGYSLPSADYEFKYLLKRIQISRRRSPDIILVTGGDDPQATYDNYQRFFGRVMDKESGYFPGGLTRQAVGAITRAR